MVEAAAMIPVIVASVPTAATNHRLNGSTAHPKQGSRRRRSLAPVRVADVYLQFCYLLRQFWSETDANVSAFQPARSEADASFSDNEPSISLWLSVVPEISSIAMKSSPS
jgi:hypothetical protein